MPLGFEDERQLLIHDEARRQKVSGHQQHGDARPRNVLDNLLVPVVARRKVAIVPIIDAAIADVGKENLAQLVQPLFIQVAVAHKDPVAGLKRRTNGSRRGHAESPFVGGLVRTGSLR